MVGAFRKFLAVLIVCIGIVAPSFAANVAGITPCASGSLSVSGVTSNIQLSACGPVVILYNITTQEAFYNLGTSSATAATTSNFSIPGSSYVVLNVSQTPAQYLAAITAAATTTIRIVQGHAQ